MAQRARGNRGVQEEESEQHGEEYPQIGSKIPAIENKTRREEGRTEASKT